MGFYINPPNDQPKEEWLRKNGERKRRTDITGFNFNSDKLPVCLVDNGDFTAAGIAIDARELDRFLEVDHRKKEWWVVAKTALEPFVPMEILFSRRERV